MRFVCSSPFLVFRTEAKSIENAGKIARNGNESHASAQMDVELIEAAPGHARMGDGFHEDSERI
jgi:hypothetical protein